MPKPLETYQMLTVKRNEIHLSDYNPRRISEGAKKKLKRNIKAHGFVQPIIINSRTMRVVRRAPAACHSR
jgi:ParB-like chromosome segregation protein Spo0J